MIHISMTRVHKKMLAQYASFKADVHDILGAAICICVGLSVTELLCTKVISIMSNKYNSSNACRKIER